jgi:hypothetical protein
MYRDLFFQEKGLYGRIRNNSIRNASKDNSHTLPKVWTPQLSYTEKELQRLRLSFAEDEKSDMAMETH